MTSWLAEREQRTFFDWRYYLVKYPAMRGSRDERREGRTGIYWGVDGELGYSLCMLRTYSSTATTATHPAAGVALLRREGRGA